MAKENIDPKKAAEVRNQLDAAAAAQERAATSAKKYTDQLEKALESIVHINESGKQTEKDLKKRASLLKKVEEITEDLGASEDQVLLIQKDILDGKIKSVKAIRQEIKETKKGFDAEKNINKVSQINEAIQERQRDLKKETLDIGRSLNEQAKGEKNAIEEVLGFAKDGTEQAFLDLEIQKEKVRKAAAFGAITEDQANMMLKGLDIEEERLQAADNLSRIMGDQQGNIMPEFNQALKAANNIFGDMQSQVTGVFEKFPGGSYIVEKLGLDKLQSNLSNAFMDGLGTFSSALQTNLAAGMSQGQAFTSALTAGFGAVKGSIMAMMSPFAIFAAAVGGLLYILMDNNKQAKELAENMGVSKLQAKALMRNASEAAGSMNTMYATMDDILDVQKAFNDEMGNGLIISAEQAAATADIGIAFGYGADEAAKVNAQLMRMGASIEEANEIQTFTAALADASGVPVGKVMEDVAQNGKKAAKFMKGNAKELAKAAVEAAKMGMSLESMVSMAEGLLNIEENLEATAVANAMTGKSMNMDRARALALEGELVKMGQEVLKQVGSVAEFNEMNFKQKEAVAKAAGMEVEELENTLALQEKMAGMTDDQIEAASKLGLTAAELEDMNQDDIMNRVAQADAAERLGKQITNIKNEIKQALLPLAEAFGQALEFILPVVKLIGAAIQGFLAPFTAVFKVVNSIVSGIKNFLADLGILEPMLAGMKKIFQGIGLILAIKIMPNIVKMGLEMAKQAVSHLPSMIKSFGTIAYKVMTEILPAVVKMTLKFAYQALTLLPTMIGYMGSMVISLGKAVLAAGKMVVKLIMGAVGMIYQAFGALGIIGIALAAGAVGVMYAQSKKAEKAGDVAIDPNGGPVVASPQEGTLFQGTTNDGVSMSPAHGSSGGGSTIQNKLTPQDIVNQTNALTEILRQILVGVQTPPPVVVGENQAKDIGNIVGAAKSFMG